MNLSKMETRTVGVVLFKGEDVLLVRHLKGSQHIDDTYGLPAGRVDTGETEIEAALRELNEETGLLTDQKDLQELPEKYHAVLKRKQGEEAMVMTVFLCLKYTGQSKSSVETDPQWVNIEKIDTLKLIPNVVNAIRQAISFRKS
jgi:8-oxo-dGTP diphosphatase